MNNLTWPEFERVEMRVGTILSAVLSRKAKRPAYRLSINLGELGVLTSSAQLTERYSPEELMGRQVIAVCNFPDKQVADVMSQCLVLGALDDAKGTVLLSVEQEVAAGTRVA